MLYLSLKCFNALFVVTLCFADQKKDLTFMDMLKFYVFVIRSSSGLITFNCWKKQVKLSDFQEHL